jgi:hypothetical protein
MTFKLGHHNKILAILECLDSNLLKVSCAYFGGGTLLSLDFDEYRLSNDIDFICAVPSSGYRNLRKVVFEGGYTALFSNSGSIQIGRGMADQYGIRMVIHIDGEPIKTEIIAEGRFTLDLPRYPEWSPVACLSWNDCFTAKLLANSDRFMDDSVQSRDLIDLAILRLQSSIPSEAIQKAENAYAVLAPLANAVQRFQNREDYRFKCFANLRISDLHIPKIMDGLDLLADDFNLPRTTRTFKET